jgi:K+ potassium transporter
MRRLLAVGNVMFAAPPLAQPEGSLPSFLQTRSSAASGSSATTRDRPAGDTAAAPAPAHEATSPPPKSRLSALTLAAIGVVFGDILVLGLLGVIQIVQAPHILRAVDPSYALALFAAHEWLAFVTLGAVFLAVTGAEALYADMGHFGPLPIRIACSGSFCRRFCSTTSVKARCCSPIAPRWPIRSTCSPPRGRCIRWSCSPPGPR